MISLILLLFPLSWVNFVTSSTTNVHNVRDWKRRVWNATNECTHYDQVSTNHSALSPRIRTISLPFSANPSTNSTDKCWPIRDWLPTLKSPSPTPKQWATRAESGVGIWTWITLGVGRITLRWIEYTISKTPSTNHRRSNLQTGHTIRVFGEIKVFENT